MSDSNVFRGKGFFSNPKNSEDNMLTSFSWFVFLFIAVGVVLFIVVMTLCCCYVEKVTWIVCFKKKRLRVPRNRVERLMMMMQSEDENRISTRAGRTAHERRHFDSETITDLTVCEPYVYQDRDTTGTRLPAFTVVRMHSIIPIDAYQDAYHSAITTVNMETTSSYSFVDPDRHICPLTEMVDIEQPEPPPPEYSEVLRENYLRNNFRLSGNNQKYEEPPPPSYTECMRNNYSRSNKKSRQQL